MIHSENDTRYICPSRQSVGSACEILFGQDRATFDKRDKRNDDSQKYRNLQVTKLGRLVIEHSGAGGFSLSKKYILMPSLSANLN